MANDPTPPKIKLPHPSSRRWAERCMNQTNNEYPDLVAAASMLNALTDKGHPFLLGYQKTRLNIATDYIACSAGLPVSSSEKALEAMKRLTEAVVQVYARHPSPNTPQNLGYQTDTKEDGSTGIPTLVGVLSFNAPDEKSVREFITAHRKEIETTLSASLTNGVSARLLH